MNHLNPTAADARDARRARFVPGYGYRTLDRLSSSTVPIVNDATNSYSKNDRSDQVAEYNQKYDHQFLLPSAAPRGKLLPVVGDVTVAAARGISTLAADTDVTGTLTAVGSRCR